MSHERVTHLRLSADAQWDEVLARAEALATALAATPGCERLRLVRVDETHAMLLTAFSDAASLESITTDVIDPWIGERLQPLLAEPARSVEGEALVALTRVSGEDWAAHDALGDGERVVDFVRHVSQSQTVWGLYGESWARAPRDDGREALPFWPRMELAARCIADEWSELSPRRIALDEFLDQWLPGMDEDGIVAVISTTPDAPGATVSAATLTAALQTSADA